MITCEQFRELNTPPERIFTTTRGERAACLLHANQPCKKCQRWLLEKQSAVDLTDKQWAVLDKMRYDDYQDVEFMKASGLCKWAEAPGIELHEVTIISVDGPEQLIEALRRITGQ